MVAGLAADAKDDDARSDQGDTVLVVGAAALLAVGGNGLRTAALFWADTNAPQLPSFAHAGIGAVAFAMATGALFAVARALAAGEGRACAPSA